MTKRVRLNEVPYEGIEVGEKVMYLTTHGKNTSINYGFYCGTYLFTPVVEYFYRERKWVWNKDRKRYVQSKNWTVSSQRVFLHRRRIFGIKKFTEMLNITPSYDDINRLLKQS